MATKPPPGFRFKFRFNELHREPGGAVRPRYEIHSHVVPSPATQERPRLSEHVVGCYERVSLFAPKCSGVVVPVIALVEQRHPE